MNRHVKKHRDNQFHASLDILKRMFLIYDYIRQKSPTRKQLFDYIISELPDKDYGIRSLDRDIQSLKNAFFLPMISTGGKGGHYFLDESAEITGDLDLVNRLRKNLIKYSLLIDKVKMEHKGNKAAKVNPVKKVAVRNALPEVQLHRLDQLVKALSEAGFTPRVDEENFSAYVVAHTHYMAIDKLKGKELVYEYSLAYAHEREVRCFYSEKWIQEDGNYCWYVATSNDASEWIAGNSIASLIEEIKSPFIEGRYHFFGLQFTSEGPLTRLSDSIDETTDEAEDDEEAFEIMPKKAKPKLKNSNP